MMSLEDNLVFVNGSIPYSEEPFFLSVLYAILGGVTPENYFPAKIINVISHSVTVLFTFLLTKKLFDGRWIALVTGILVSLSFPLLWDIHHMISEPLFIAFTAAVLYFLILTRDSSGYILSRNLIIAGICASIAVLTRYAGVALIPVLCWNAFILKNNKSTKLKSASIIISTMLPPMTAGALFMNAYITSGTIFGRTPPDPGRSYLSAFSGTLKMMFLQFNLGDRPTALLTACLMGLVLYILFSVHARKELSKYIHSGIGLIMVFIISYIALITYAMATAQTVFEDRFMHPLVPFIFILIIFFIVFVREMMKLKGFSKLSLYWLILSLAIISLGNCYKTYMHSGDFTSENGRQYFVPNSSTYKWLKENYGENVIITTNKSFPLSFFGGYSTVQLPHKRFQKNFRIPEDMEMFLPDRMSAFGSRVLALFEEADDQHEGRYIAGLFNKREDDKNFILIQKFSDGVVYNLKE